MKSVKLIVFILAILCSFQAFAQRPPQATKVAVLNLQAQTGIDESAAVLISESFLAEVRKVKGIEVIGMAEITTMLGYEQQKQTIGCSEDSCIVEIGGALGVDKIVSGVLGKIGTSFIINIKLLNIREAKVDKQVSRRFRSSSEEVFLDALPGITRELFAAEPQQRQGQPPPPPPIAGTESGAPYPSTMAAPPPIVISDDEADTGEPIQPSAERYDETPTETAEEGEEKPTRSKGLLIGGIVTGSIGVASVALGGYAVYEAKNQTSADDELAMKGAAYLFFGLGGALVVTSAILFIVDAVKAKQFKAAQEDAAASTAASYQITPVVMGDGAALSMKLNF